MVLFLSCSLPAAVSGTAGCTGWRRCLRNPSDGGACVSLGDEQIAIFNFSRRGEWYATENRCPHKQQMALSRGMTGSVGEQCEPKVACPFHKKTFSLVTGECLSGEEYRIRTYPVKVKDGKVYICV